MKAQSWRTRVRVARGLIRDARTVRGRRRRALLLEAAKIVDQLCSQKEPTARADREAFVRAEWSLEVELGRLVKCCIGCLVHDPGAAEAFLGAGARRVGGSPPAARGTVTPAQEAGLDARRPPKARPATARRSPSPKPATCRPRRSTP